MSSWALLSNQWLQSTSSYFLPPPVNKSWNSLKKNNLKLHKKAPVSRQHQHQHPAQGSTNSQQVIHWSAPLCCYFTISFLSMICAILQSCVVLTAQSSAMVSTQYNFSYCAWYSLNQNAFSFQICFNFIFPYTIGSRISVMMHMLYFESKKLS